MGAYQKIGSCVGRDCPSPKLCRPIVLCLLVTLPDGMNVVTMSYATHLHRIPKSVQLTILATASDLMSPVPLAKCDAN
jgi:hypothetical protein